MAPTSLPRLVSVTDTAFEALSKYIESTTARGDALVAARREAEEFGVNAPDEAVGQLLATLTATATAGRADANVVAITSAANVVGLHFLDALPDKGVLTCINPEATHNNQAKATFRDAGYAAARARFLTARPLEVMGRLASDTYQVVYADVSPMDLSAVIDSAWSLLTVGGTLVLADSLLDGTIADQTRTDRDTAGAREADAKALELADAQVTRLPLGAGLTLITRLR